MRHYETNDAHENEDRSERVGCLVCRKIIKRLGPGLCLSVSVWRAHHGASRSISLVTLRSLLAISLSNTLHSEVLLFLSRPSTADT